MEEEEEEEGEEVERWRDQETEVWQSLCQALSFNGLEFTGRVTAVWLYVWRYYNRDGK